jgi:hypothetical protein
MVLACWFFSPWWWRRYVPLKRRLLQEPHGVTFQKKSVFIATAVKSSNLTSEGVCLWFVLRRHHCKCCSDSGKSVKLNDGLERIWNKGSPGHYPSIHPQGLKKKRIAKTPGQDSRRPGRNSDRKPLEDKNATVGNPFWVHRKRMLNKVSCWVSAPSVRIVYRLQTGRQPKPGSIRGRGRGFPLLQSGQTAYVMQWVAYRDTSCSAVHRPQSLRRVACDIGA